MKAKVSRGGLALIALVMAWLAFAGSSRAADKYWIGDNGGYWDNSANWSSNDGGSGGAGQPLAGVKVIRGRPELAAQPGWTPHGGELLIRKPAPLTGPDGRFTLLGERVLTPVHWGGWSLVRLTFNRPGYLSLQTNCSAASLVATNTPSGAPALDVLRIALQKAPAKAKRP